MPKYTPPKKSVKTNTQQYSLTNNRFWFEANKNEAHHKVWNTVKSIEERQTFKRLKDADFMRMYGSGQDSLYRGFASISFRNTPIYASNNRLCYNVCQNVIDALTSKIGTKQKAKPLFLPSGAEDHTIRLKAEQLTDLMAGQFEQLKVYRKAIKVFRDGCVGGTGVLKADIERDEEGNQSIYAERVLPIEVLVDEMEGLYGDPKNMYQTKLVSKAYLINEYPELQQEILHANPVRDIYDPESLIDHCEVVEAWHLSENPNDPGRKVICIENTTLYDEEYTRKTFPFIFFRYTEKLAGFFGEGVIERVMGQQLEINRLLLKKQKLIELHGTPWIILGQNEDLPTNKISNRLGNILRYKNKPPQVQVNQCYTPEIMTDIKEHIRAVYDQVGITELSATGKKPPGVTAAVAMREMAEIESERFQETAENFQNFFLDIATHLVTLNKELKELKVPVKGEDFFNLIDWKDVDLEEDQYVIQLFPVSLLPSRPEGKLQYVQELIEGGFIDKQDGEELLNLPDTKANYNLRAAGRKLAQKQVDQILNKGEYTSPEPKMDLNYALQYANNSWLLGRSRKYPEENLNLLATYMDAIDGLQKELQAKQAPPVSMPAPPAPVPGPPMKGPGSILPRSQ